MPEIKSFRDLEVWALSMELTTAIYRLTERYPRHELFGVTGQTRRAAVSIPANVAEGHSRRATRAYRNHVGIAMGSQAELDTLVEVALRLGYASRTELGPLLSLLTRVGQMLGGLYRSFGGDENACRSASLFSPGSSRDTAAPGAQGGCGSAEFRLLLGLVDVFALALAAGNFVLSGIHVDSSAHTAIVSNRLPWQATWRASDNPCLAR